MSGCSGFVVVAVVDALVVLSALRGDIELADIDDDIRADFLDSLDEVVDALK